VKESNAFSTSINFKGAFDAFIFSSHFRDDRHVEHSGICHHAVQDGLDGRTGMSTSIVATGQSASYNLDGDDGSDGSDGETGEDALNCQQPTPADNVIGAAGGLGGDGGKAGNGGNGGDVTVYATDMSALSKILVSSRPGQGARTGRAGVGGRGCYCTTSSWSAQQCKPVKNADGTTHTVCQSANFTCTNGTDGTDGKQGQDFGNAGTTGHLIVIKQLSDPAQDNPTASIAFQNAFSSGNITLTKNIWSTQNGAQQLLAPGSIVADDYKSFNGQNQITSSFTWNVNRPVTDFNIQMGLAIDDTGTQVGLQLPDSVWYRVTQNMSGQNAHFTFTQMLNVSEVTQLTMQMTGTNASDLIATITDSTDSSDLVDTVFDADLEIPGFFWGTELFNGRIPADLIQRNGRVFTIQLSKLPNLDISKIQPGTKLDLDITAGRSMDSFSTSQDLEVEIQLPGGQN
jgi:hypothetical protein